MHADAFFTIGKTHKVCESYALAGKLDRGDLDPLPPALLALVSDGCSTGHHTDFGSRLLVMAALEVFSLDGHLGDGRKVVRRAMEMGSDINLPGSAFAATLMAVSHQTGDDVARAVAWGDGVVAGRRRDGGIDYFTIEYPSGAPAYLWYLTDDTKTIGYLEQFGGTQIVTEFQDMQEVSSWESEDIFAPEVFDFPVAEYDLVMVMDDGAQSFMAPDPKYGNRPSRVMLEGILPQVMDIHGATGEFLTRRVRNGFLRKHCVQNNWDHHDDLAIGALWLSDP